MYTWNYRYIFARNSNLKWIVIKHVFLLKQTDLAILKATSIRNSMFGFLTTHSMNWRQAPLADSQTNICSNIDRESRFHQKPQRKNGTYSTRIRWNKIAELNSLNANRLLNYWEVNISAKTITTSSLPIEQCSQPRDPNSKNVFCSPQTNKKNIS